MLSLSVYCELLVIAFSVLTVNDKALPNYEPSFDIVGRRAAAARVCKNWVCGTVEDPGKKLTDEEKQVIRQKMTSLKEHKFWRIVLNVVAVALAILTSFLLGFFG